MTEPAARQGIGTENLERGRQATPGATTTPPIPLWTSEFGELPMDVSGRLVQLTQRDAAAEQPLGQPLADPDPEPPCQASSLGPTYRAR